MKKISVSENETFYVDSKNISVEPGTKYLVSTQVTGIKGKPVSGATHGKWKIDFSEEEQKIMNEIMVETLIKLGYKI